MKYHRFPWMAARAIAISVAAVGAVPIMCSAAWANGIDLRARQGIPGERIHVDGHDWLTCCPRNTPVPHVRLFLLARDGRLLLFDVAANPKGEISTSFVVPELPPGRYHLEACGGLPGQIACLPEGRFKILPREAILASTGIVGGWLWLGGVLIGVGGVVLICAPKFVPGCSHRDNSGTEKHRSP